MSEGYLVVGGPRHGEWIAMLPEQRDMTILEMRADPARMLDVVVEHHYALLEAGEGTKIWLWGFSVG